MFSKNDVVIGITNQLIFLAAFRELQKLEKKYKKQNYSDAEINEIFLMMNKIIKAVTDDPKGFYYKCENCDAELKFGAMEIDGEIICPVCDCSLMTKKMNNGTPAPIKDESINMEDIPF